MSKLISRAALSTLECQSHPVLIVFEYAGSSRAQATENAPKTTRDLISKATIRRQKKERKIDHTAVYQCH